MKKIIVVALLIFAPFFAKASVSTNEIMYDLEGSDTDREWFEIYNNGSEPVDVSAYKFFLTDGINHALSSFQGQSIMPANSYAVIAVRPEKFLIDWPNFSGTIFDASFSLKNTGDTISLKDNNSAIVDAASYSSDQGANGDGKSLQKSGSGWGAFVPTPGMVNFNSSNGSNNNGNNDSQNQNNNQSGTSVANNSGSASSSTKKEDSVPKFSTQILAKANGIAKVVILFDSLTTGLNKEILTKGKYFWNFGDGSTKESQAEEKFYHAYDYPGDYVATLEYYNNFYSLEPSATDRFVIKINPAQVEISKAENNFIELSNSSSYEVDLSKWALNFSGVNFIIPQNTIILPDKKITFSSFVTKIIFSKTGADHDQKNSELKLLYPDGEAAFLYGGSQNEQMVDVADSASVKILSENIKNLIEKNNLADDNKKTKDGVVVKEGAKIVSVQDSSSNDSENISDNDVLGSDGSNVISLDKNDLSANVLAGARKLSGKLYFLFLIGIIVIASIPVVLIRKSLKNKSKNKNQDNEDNSSNIEIIE